MEPIDQPIEMLAPALRAGSLSPVALTEAALERIRLRDGLIESFVAVSDGAIGAAREAERELREGSWRGPLHGVPVGIKDMFDTAGIRTTAAFEHFRNRIPSKDAEAVRKLKEAGAIIIGKTNLHKLAMGTTSAVSDFGPVHNPWNPDYIAGGSSGGSAAALAAGRNVLTEPEAKRLLECFDIPVPKTRIASTRFGSHGWVANTSMYLPMPWLPSSCCSRNASRLNSS